MRFMKVVAALAFTALLASCGSGGCDAGSSPLTGTTSCGGTTAADPVAAKLVLELSKLSVNNSGGETVTATATATTAGGQTVKGVPVTFSVDSNALYTPASTSTSDAGIVTAVVSIGSDRSNRIVTVTAVSGSLTSSASFVVSGAKVTGTPSPAVVNPGDTGNVINFAVKDANANPMAGQPITVTAASLGSVNGVTDANGAFVYTYTAPAATGNLDFTATSGGDTATVTVIVQAAPGAIPNVTTPILSASVSANPSVVATNSASTNNRTEIRALFLGANNLPIKNVRVRFDLDGDANSIGGTFSTGSNIVYSDANGVAVTSYIPGSRSSPTNGLTIRACYDSVDFTTCDPIKSTKATLTVISEALSVTLGTDRQIIVNELTYSQKFVVLVVDAAGQAKANVEIVPSVDLPLFIKGFYQRVGGTWVSQVLPPPPTGFVATTPVACLNEDLNRNGVLEAGEDLDGDNVLEPRKSDVAIKMVGSTKTNESGLAFLQIEYPKNLASWAQFKILVSASGISGTEGRASWTQVLGVPVSDVKLEGAPPFVVSPYGTVTTGADPCSDQN